MQLLRSGPPCRAGSFTVHFNSLSIAPDLIPCPCHAKRDRQAAPVWHFMPFSRALRARGSLCKGIKKNFSTPPSENPAPPDFRLPGRRCAASATATQRPPAIFNAGNSTNPFDVLGCTRLQCRFVNVVFHLARTADKTTVFLAEPQRQGRKPHTITL